jgi:hypothetical protein
MSADRIAALRQKIHNERIILERYQSDLAQATDRAATQRSYIEGLKDALDLIEATPAETEAAPKRKRRRPAVDMPVDAAFEAQDRSAAE